MKEEVKWLVCGFGFFVVAMMDVYGSQILVRKQYRGASGVNHWLIRQAILHTIVGLCSMCGYALHYFNLENSRMLRWIGLIIVIDAALIGVNGIVYRIKNRK